MQVSMRPAEPADAEALALVGQATFLETYAGLLPGADILAHCQREHAASRYAAWLDDGESLIWLVEASEGAAPVGYAVVAPPDLPIPTAPGDLELKRFYLLERLQGRGLGVRLMDLVVKGARRNGAPRLLVGVFAANSRAIAFYARQGFSTAGARQFRVGQGVYDDLVLARPLTEPAQRI